MPDLPQSNLEFTFDFRDPVFYSYINIVEPGSPYAPPLHLIRMAVAMSKHHHPLVRFAGGWAAAEAGTINRWFGIKNRWTLPHREEALDIGNSIWLGIDDDEWEQFAPPDDDRLQAQMWSFNMRQHIAMAYLPSLQLAARARVGEPVTAQEAYERFKRVKQGLMPTIRTLLADPDSATIHSRAMRGLAREIAAAWMLQHEFLQLAPPPKDTPQPEYVVTPASLRDDHHRRPADRCDLNIFSLGGRGKRLPVQVGLQKEIRLNAFEITQSDLGGAATQQQFLRRIYKYEMGNPRPSAFLARISNKLRNRMKRNQLQLPDPKQRGPN